MSQQGRHKCLVLILSATLAGAVTGCPDKTADICNRMASATEACINAFDETTFEPIRQQECEDSLSSCSDSELDQLESAASCLEGACNEKNSLGAIACAFSMANVKCLQSQEDFTIPDTPLAGEVNGADWTFVAGVVSTSFSDSSKLTASLYDLGSVSCETTPSDGQYVQMIFEDKTGDYELSLFDSGPVNVDFVVVDGNSITSHVATNGKVSVTEVSSTGAKGAMNVKADDDNWVKGTFELTRCPQP